MKGRIRSSKPELWKHWLLWHLGEITNLPKLAFWYDGLFHYTDREGRFEWNATRLKAELAPFDNVNFEHVLNVLANGAFVVKYRVGVRQYGWIPRFLVHQQINGREQPSVLPAPPPEVMAFYEQLVLSDSFADLTESAARSAPPVLSAVGNAPSDNDLQNGSRVSDASATRGSRVADADSILFYSTSLSLQRDQNSLENGAASEKHDETPTRALARLDVGGRNARALPAVRGPRDASAIRDRVSQVFAEIAEQSRTRISREQLRRLQAEMVFLYWTARFNHPNALLDRKREQKIIARLDENDGNVSELLYALDGASHDAFIMGDNERGKKYDDLVTILRDRSQVERFASTRKKYRDGIEHAMLGKLQATLSGRAGSGVVQNGEPPSSTRE